MLLRQSLKNKWSSSISKYYKTNLLILILTKDINPSASKSTKTQENKSAKEQIKTEKAKALAEAQKEALKAKLMRWQDESKQILKLLQTKYPLCFSIPVKPLAIGISKEVIELEKDNFSKQQIRRFFRRYCSDYRYKKLLVEGAQRFNLDGTPAALVTKEEVPPRLTNSLTLKNLKFLILKDIILKKYYKGY